MVFSQAVLRPTTHNEKDNVIVTPSTLGWANCRCRSLHHAADVRGDALRLWRRTHEDCTRRQYVDCSREQYDGVRYNAKEFS